MTSNDMIHIKGCSSSIKGLASEYTAKGTVVLFANLGNYSIHGPAVKVIIGKYFERNVVLLLVSLDCLRTDMSQKQNCKGYEPRESRRDSR